MLRWWSQVELGLLTKPRRAKLSAGKRREWGEVASRESVYRPNKPSSKQLQSDPIKPHHIYLVE